MRFFGLILSLLMVTQLAWAGGKKPSKPYAEAKKECLAESPNVKGKALQTCIKSKKKK